MSFPRRRFLCMVSYAFGSSFVLPDSDKMLAQLRAAGIEVKAPETYPGMGKFTPAA